MRRISLVIAGILFILAGTFHFVAPEPYTKIMPLWVKWPLAAVYISGAAEILGGLGLLIPLVKRPAAWGLAILLIAVFPANIHMARYNIQVGGTAIPQSLLWARLALQPLMIWWVLWSAEV